jgi:putative transcriptional regulator
MKSVPARPLDALLAQYAAGEVRGPLHALVAAHLELNGASRRFVADLDRLRGQAMAEAEPRPLSRRDDILASILASAEAGGRPEPAAPDAIFTPSLRRYLGFASHETPWRTVLPGLKEHLVSSQDGVEARLYWIRAGRKMPHHTHEGQEVTLVLQGAFADASGHFARGDVAVADDSRFFNGFMRQ